MKRSEINVVRKETDTMCGNTMLPATFLCLYSRVVTECKPRVSGSEVG